MWLGFRDIYFPKSSSSRTIAKRRSCKPLGSTILPFVVDSVVFLLGRSPPVAQLPTVADGSSVGQPV